MSFWSAVSVGFFFPSRSNFSISCSQQWINTIGWNRSFPSVQSFCEFLHLLWIGVNSRFKKKNGGRGEESVGRNRSFFKSEGKLICAKICYLTIYWSSKMCFVCTCISPVLSLALLIVTMERNTPSRQLAERWKAQAGVLGLNQHPVWPLPSPLRVSWPSGCSASLSSVTTWCRNYHVEVKGLWKPQSCFV